MQTFYFSSAINLLGLYLLQIALEIVMISVQCTYAKMMYLYIVMYRHIAQGNPYHILALYFHLLHDVGEDLSRFVCKRKPLKPCLKVKGKFS